MADIKKCPQCGTELPPDAAAEFCPKCMLQVGLGTQAQGGDTQPMPQAPAPMPVADVARLFPQLEVLDILGQGGMGVVYKARQPRLDRLVALKILPAEAGRDAAFAERFNREARALAKLSHPNVVAVYDFGESGGHFYFLMEFVDGLNLRQLERAGDLTPAQALKIVPAICEALQYAHDQGVVHRDIKPENILVDKAGRVKIADFGLAKLLGAPARDQKLTASQQVMGTPHYMAPEQVETPQAVDHRADIYSLGVVFYEMLTGELPIGRFAPPSRKVHVDVRLDEIVLRSLEKERDRRYQHASDVKTDVETLASTPPQLAAPQAPNEWELARRAVRAPATALLITGILNWLLVPLLVMILMYFLAHDGSQALPGGLLTAGIAIVAVSTFMMIAALKMKALEAYWLAVTGSILAILISPGNLIGLPIGIWALVTLTRRPVKDAFRTGRPPGALLAEPAPPPGDGARRVFFTAATVVLIGIVMVGLLVVGGVMLSLALPALSRAKQRAQLYAAHNAVPLKSFSLTNAPLAPALTVTNDAWLLRSTSNQVVRLFEVPNPTVKLPGMLIYRAQLKAERFEGRAYLEMWCRFPGKGEFFARALDRPITGSTEWISCDAPFFLNHGEQPDLIKLNLVVEGTGDIGIRNPQLLQTSTAH